MVEMRRVRLTVLPAALAAVAVVLGSGSGEARTAAVPSVTLDSGGFVVFKGTHVQCLIFGPIDKIAGKRGIFCFVGPPKRHRSGTYWIAWTPTDDYSGTSGASPTFRAVTSATTIKSTVMTTGGTLVRVSGTEIGCVFQVNQLVDLGHKAVFCSDVDSRGRPYRGSDGVALSDRYLAFVSFDSSRRLHVKERDRHPG